MAKAQGKVLNDSKVYDFIGIEDNVDPLSNRKSVVSCTNLEPHVEPGKFLLREPYQLRYKKPTDPIYQRNNSEEFISFDNFYEKTARDQAEVTVLVSKAEINAPIIGGSRITGYKYNSVNIYIRPYWTGSYWKNAWLWLNEPIITKVTVAPDATYKNKIQVSGYFGNMLQWTLLNVTKDKTVPYAILRSAQNGSNTDLWLSYWDPQFSVNDEIVLMRNYIPIKYLIQNYNVLREEIHFHRILSRMRIGFGGKEGRMALGIDYEHKTLRLSNYNFSATDPLMDPLLFANANKVIIQPYIQFNESNADFDIQINYTPGGVLGAGTYYFRMTAVYDDVDEVMVVEKSITTTAYFTFLPLPIIRLGSLSRRLSQVKIYFSENGLDYYFYKAFQLTSNSDSIDAREWILGGDGYLSYNAVGSASNLHTELNAASGADANLLGSWFTTQEHCSVSVVAATNFAIELLSTGSNVTTIRVAYPINKLSEILQPGRTYTIQLKHKTTKTGTSIVGIYMANNTRTVVRSLADIGINSSSYTDYSVDITIPNDITQPGEYNLEFSLGGLGWIFSGNTYLIESFSITEKDTVVIRDPLTDLGAEMNSVLGYQPTFNLVRDWQNAIYLNGITYVAPAFIEKRYNTYVFGSQINGDGANMHDVIPAGGSVFPVDEYRGEIVTGMVVMHNLNIAVFTDGGLIVLDPDTGNTREVARGFGLKVKGSVMVFRGSIIYASDDDFIQISAATGYEAVPISTRSVRKIYNSLPDKLKLSACFDRFGTYHVALGEDAEFRELILTDRGWINQDRQHYPQVFRNGLGGRVWFLNNGDIYAMPYSEEEFIGYADLYGDYKSGW